ncbi:MAG: DnaJ domain-containing protein [Deltaproteobacteria bacterium]
MVLPREVFLRHHDGAAVGPLLTRDLEVLFDSRVVDEGTWVSHDGTAFKTLREWPELLARLLEVKEMLGIGGDPWADAEDVDSGPRTAADEDASLLRVLLDTAVSKASGHLVLEDTDGKLTITFKDGKVGTIDTDIPALSLESYLLKHKICDADAIATGKERAPAMGGDLGAALISTGAVQPHEWFEKLVAWAYETLASAVSREFDQRNFEAADVPAPPVPLGMDRLGVSFELVRRLDTARLVELIEESGGCPVIPSQVEGVTIEDTKPKPRELRVLNAIDGVKTVDELVEANGGDEKALRWVRQAIYYAVRTGFAVLGEDPRLKKEREEAVALVEKYERMREQTMFDLLNVTEKSTDEEVRARYTEYAKLYHPDTLRSNAAEELLEARKRIFELIGEAFEAVDTEDKRFQYAHDLEQGLVGSSQDLQKVQDALQSETLFKKAEILLRVKKYKEALQHIEQAIALNDDDIEFKVLRSYIVYLDAAKQGDAVPAATAAIKHILALMKNNANIASGYLYLGHLNKVVDKGPLAIKYFEKVLEYDENHPEALREVRIARLRESKKKKKKRWPL